MEPVESQEHVEPPTQDPVSSGSDEEGTCAYRSEKFAMLAQHENTLIQWFSEHPEFYQKSHRRYADKPYKDKQLGIIAAQLDEPSDKIIGWFRNQRTAVGKVYKHKSGQAPEKLTQQKAWQVKAFAFLKEHITPWSYTVELAVIPSTARSASRASNEDSEDDSTRTSVSACDAQPESSTSVARRKSSALPKKKAWHVDDALLDYLSRPCPSDNIVEQLESLTAPRDKRAAFGQWVISRMAKVPNARWEQFQRAAFDLVLMWTRPPSLALQNQPQQHAQGYVQPYQQHAQGYSQCFTPQFQQRQPQASPSSSHRSHRRCHHGFRVSHQPYRVLPRGTQLPPASRAHRLWEAPHSSASLRGFCMPPSHQVRSRGQKQERM